MSKQQTDIAIPESTTIATTQADFEESLRENVTSLSIWELGRVKIPAGGATSWEIEDPVTGPTSAKTLTGIIVCQQDVRQYYSGPMTGETAPPDCYSPDAKVGIGNPGGACHACPLAQWGTGHDAAGNATKGQACGLRKHLLLLLDGRRMPVLVNVPPTSLKSLKAYLLGLCDHDLPYYKAVTELSLVSAKSAAGPTYSQLALRFGGPVPADRLPTIIEYRRIFGPFLGQAAGETRGGDEQ